MKEEHSYLYIVELDVSYSKYVDSAMLIKFNKIRIYNLRILFFILSYSSFTHAHAHTHTHYILLLYSRILYNENGNGFIYEQHK